MHNVKHDNNVTNLTATSSSPVTKFPQSIETSRKTIFANLAGGYIWQVFEDYEGQGLGTPCDVVASEADAYDAYVETLRYDPINRDSVAVLRIGIGPNGLPCGAEDVTQSLEDQRQARITQFAAE